MSDEFVARAEQLRSEVKRHKTAIRQHRDQLGAAKAALDSLEAECRRHGISLVIVNPSGAGEIHGPDKTAP